MHVFNAEILFKHTSEVNLYKDQLQSWLRGNVTRCERSIFIFDEMDHMPAGLIDTIKPFLGTDPSVQGVDYRKSMFIFLSNSGGKEIAEMTYELWKSGKIREKIRLRDMQELLIRAAFNHEGGMENSEIITKNLVDHFIPFLPLERKHVRLCVKDALARLSSDLGRLLVPSDDLIEEVLEELQWFPSDSKLYSKSGCKKVENKLKLLV